MAVRIQNRSRALVTLQLNSGASVHLAPGERSAGIAALEVAGNPWVAEWERRGLVAVASAGTRPGAPKAAKLPRKPSKGRSPKARRAGKE